MLDGHSGGSYLRSDAADTASSRITFSGNATSDHDDMASSTGSMGSIEVYNSGSGNDAFMAFHTGSDYALYFGLDADTNSLAVGGWSMGAVKHKIIHQGNVGSGGDLASSNVYVNQIHGDGSNLTNLPSSGGSTPAVKTSNYTASSGDYVFVNASGLTITLPSSPSAGDNVKIRIIGTNYATIARNSSNIESAAEDFYHDLADKCATFTYANSSLGWQVGC